MNLLKETKKILKEYGKSVKDIVAVQGANFGMSVDTFLELADTEYDAGYGSPKVAEDLVVIGEDWFLERHEYDGSEWWEYKAMIKILPINENVYALTINQSCEDISCGWETLARINGIEVNANE